MRAGKRDTSQPSAGRMTLEHAVDMRRRRLDSQERLGLLPSAEGRE
jgi:hypothetical protein